MLKVLLVILIVGLLLLAVEYLWRIKSYRTEFTRKFVHLTIGTFAAFWPYFLSWDQIQLLALLFFVVVVASRLLTIFGSIHIIDRKTIGELLFAVAISVTALVTHDRLIYTIALLHLSIADGLAAMVGTKFNKNHAYKVFGQKKTVIGTLTFLICSVILVGTYFAISHAPGAFPKILWLPLAATIMENAGLRGSDNVLAPLIVALALRF